MAASSALPVSLFLDPWPTLVAASLAIEVSKLANFTSLMAAAGHALETSRLFLDPSYAYKHLAYAQRSPDDALRVLAIELSERYRALERRRGHVSAHRQAH